MIFFPFQFIYLIIFLLHPHEKLLFFMKWPRSLWTIYEFKIILFFMKWPRLFWTICEVKIEMEKSLDEISGWIAHYNPNTSFPFYSQFVWKSFPKKANIWIFPPFPQVAGNQLSFFLPILDRCFQWTNWITEGSLNFSSESKALYRLGSVRHEMVCGRRRLFRKLCLLLTAVSICCLVLLWSHLEELDADELDLSQEPDDWLTLRWVILFI